MTDKEQAEQVKQWFSNYGWPIGIAIVVGLGGSYGYKTWREHKAAAQANASDLYASMQIAAYENQADKVSSFGNELTKNYPASVYAGLGKLLQAQQQATSGNYAQAATSLSWVFKNVKSPVVLDIAHFSMAGVDMAQNKSRANLIQFSSC